MKKCSPLSYLNQIVFHMMRSWQIWVSYYIRNHKKVPKQLIIMQALSLIKSLSKDSESNNKMKINELYITM